jgi:hypothetical protein
MKSPVRLGTCDLRVMIIESVEVASIYDLIVRREGGITLDLEVSEDPPAAVKRVLAASSVRTSHSSGRFANLP